MMCSICSSVSAALTPKRRPHSGAWLYIRLPEIGGEATRSAEAIVVYADMGDESVICTPEFL